MKIFKKPFFYFFEKHACYLQLSCYATSSSYRAVAKSLPMNLELGSRPKFA